MSLRSFLLSVPYLHRSESSAATSQRTNRTGEISELTVPLARACKNEDESVKSPEVHRAV